MSSIHPCSSRCGPLRETVQYLNALAGHLSISVSMGLIGHDAAQAAYKRAREELLG